MGIAIWILLVYIFANMCILVHPEGKLPDFFYDDIAQGDRHKKHRHRAKPQMSNEDFETVYKPGDSVDSPEKPANALPAPVPPRPFYTFGRGDPTDQNLLEQQALQDEDSPFPQPDGKQFDNDDDYDLNELPKRLTKTNKWDEFNELTAAQKQKWEGKVMENSYSRQLLVREKNKQKTKAAPRTIPKPQEIDPSIGMSPYWADPNDNKSPAESHQSPAVPWGNGPGPGAGIKNMKDLSGPNDAQEPFPWDQVGGQDPYAGPGGGPPPGLGQGGQFPGGFNMGGGLPPGMGQGGGRGPGGQFPGGGFNMGGGLPPGLVQGGGRGPGGQFPGGGPNMGGGPRPDLGQGMGRGPGGGLPSGMGQGPRGQLSGGNFSMGGGLSPGLGLSGGQTPGGQFSGGGSSMGGAPISPGFGPGEGLGQNTGYGPVGPPGSAGGWVPGAGRGPAGGLDPGMGWGPGMARGSGRAPGPGGGLGPGKSRGPGGLPGPGGVRGPGGRPGMSQDQSGGQGPDGGYGPVGPPRPAGGWVPGGGKRPGMGRGPGGSPGPGGGWGPGGGPPPGMGQGPGMFNGPGGPPGTGGSLGPGGGLSPGMGRGPGGLSGPGGLPGSGGLPSQGRHRRSLDQSKRDGNKNMHRVTYYDYMNRPTRTPETMVSHLDNSFLLPGTHAGDNVPEEETNIDLLRSISVMPRPSDPSVSFDQHVSQKNVPTGNNHGKIPGPGSEGEYPNGYRPSYGVLSQPGMASFGGNFGMGKSHTGGGNSKAMALRQDQGANSGPGDYQDSIQNALRMGQGPPGFDAKESFQPGIAGENMARGPLSGNMYRWPPGMGGAPTPPPGHKDRGKWPAEWGEHPPGMGRDLPPENMQGGQPPGMGGDFSQGYIQGGQPSGMRGNQPPGYMPTSYDGFRRSLDNSTVARGGYLKPPGPFSEKPTLRKGGGLASMDYNARPADYPEIVKTALRMNQMMAQSPDEEGPPPAYMQGGPTPGMGGGPPRGYLRGGPSSGMRGGPPPGYMQGGPPPEYMQGGSPLGMGGGPPPGYMQGGPSTGMEGGPPPGYMQGGRPPGMGGGLPPEFQRRPKGPPAISGFPAGMPQGQMPKRPPGSPDYGGPGGDDPSLRYGEQGSQPPNNKIPSGYQLMKIAQRKIEFQNRLDKVKALQSEPTTEHLPTVEERLNVLRQFDDFHAPIRWVKLNSPDTRDGLARVTGELYVPIVDESMARLGWTTESADETLVEITTKPNFEEHELKIVMRSMNLNYTTQKDWLAYEIVLGTKFKSENECADESCQSRCHKTGCDCTCKGDSCASGCVGVSCNAVCRGPSCNAMCIGEQCTAKCEGLNCEAKCYGTHCSSSCSLLSCLYTINGGRSHTSNVTWDEMYPQYGHGQKFSNQNQHGNGPALRQGADYGHPPDDYYND